MMNSAPLEGKKRSFGRGVLSYIVTLSLYAWYWHYKARAEMYQQKRRNDFPTVGFILCFVPLVNLVALPMYMSNWLQEINDHRTKHQRQPIFGIGGFLAWYILGSIIIVGPFIAYSKLQGAINDFWDDEARVVSAPVTGAPPAATTAAPPSW